MDGQKVTVLDHGYVQLVESWGSDERVIEAARMSTGKGFNGWGPKHDSTCERAGDVKAHSQTCDRGCGDAPGDEKLLAYLWNNKHATPFEMAGMVIEVQAPIFVFREWHRHRTQCLAPDTLIHFDAPKSRDNRRGVYKQTIAELWRKWQPTVRSTRPERQKNALWPRSRVQSMRLRMFNESTTEIEHTRIVDIIKGDPKAMVCVTTASGREITATLAHKFFTDKGWMPLGSAIRTGAGLATETTVRGSINRWDIPTDYDGEEWRLLIDWPYEVSNHGRVRRIGCEPKKLSVGVHGYDVVSLNKPGVQVLVTVHSLVLRTWIGPRPLDYEARHLNSNRADNRVVNLAWGSSAENAEDRVRADRQQRLVVGFEEIVQVVNVGFQDTYDLTVEGPFYNFIADGFVVHNSYNEMSARYAPLPDLNYVPDITRVLVNASGTNAQANRIPGAYEATNADAKVFRELLIEQYAKAEEVYQVSLNAGIPKELARLVLPVGRYSRMRASANLRNWLAFLTLRMDPAAQWEIRQYAQVVGAFIAQLYPRTWELFELSRKKQ